MTRSTPIHRSIALGLLLGAAVTLGFAWFMQDRILNFRFCPEGTTDYCAWNLPFVVWTFGPVMVVSSLVAIGLLLVPRLRGERSGRAARG